RHGVGGNGLADDDRLDLCVGLKLVVADELGGGELPFDLVDRADVKNVARETATPADFLMLVHRGSETRPIDLDALSLGNFLGQLDGESVRRVQLERLVATNLIV